MNDRMARVLRTIAQAIVTVGAVGVAKFLESDIPDRWDKWTYPIAFVIVAAAQNLIESISGKGLLRPDSPPAPANVTPVANVP